MDAALMPASARRAGNPDACVVVPMYNEAQVVGEVVRNLREHFDQVICVDDGSSDGSAEIAALSGARVVQHCTNLGPGAALQTGLEAALRHTSAEFIVTFDADGQHQVDDALAMVDAARTESVDILLGSRFLQASSEIPRGRRILLWGAVLVTRLTTRLSLTDTHNGLRVMTRRVASSLSLELHGMAYASELQQAIVRHAFRYREFPVSVLYTDYSLAKGQHGINAVNILFDLMLARVRVAR